MQRGFFLIMLLALCATGAAASPRCPPEVKVSQRLSASVPGWKPLQNDIPHALSGITFYDGPPEEQASLVPDSTRMIKGDSVSTWRFGPTLERRIWLSCSYAGTSISLAHKLPANTRSCTATYNPGIHIADQPRLKKLSCK